MKNSTMNNLVVLKQEVLNHLKDTIEIDLYLNHDNTSTLDIIGTDFVRNPAQLVVTDDKNKSADDLNNCIKLYESLKNLPLSLASEERFWSYLTHTSYWEYMCKRWPVQEAEGDAIEFIKTRYFFSSRNKTFYRNGLSRLWWYAQLTYDNSKDNPYYYTKLMLANQEIANLLIETTTLSRNKIALTATLEVLKDLFNLEEEGHIKKLKNKRRFIRDLMKFINLVGGVTVWDTLTEKEAYEKAWLFVEKNIERIKQSTA